MGIHTETVEHWVSEYLVSTTGEMRAREFGDSCSGVLVSFMDNACGSEVHPADIEARNIRDGVAIGLGPIALDLNEREQVPELIEDFLAFCESSGRLSGGEELGRYARVTATAHLLKKGKRRRTVKVGPNDPCPCGSGRKYKKCCMHA